MSVHVLGGTVAVPPLLDEGSDSDFAGGIDDSDPAPRSELHAITDEKQRDKTRSQKDEGKITPAEKAGRGGKTIEQHSSESKEQLPERERDILDDQEEPPEIVVTKKKIKKVFPDVADVEPPIDTGNADRDEEPEPFHLIDTSARMITSGELKYPAEFSGQDIEAVSVIDIYLDRRGKVQNMEIIESGGRAFDEAAFRMILSSTFEPAYSGDLAVPCIVRLTAEFESVRGGAP